MPLAVVYWSIVSDRLKEEHKIAPPYIVFQSLWQTLKDYESLRKLWKVMKVMKTMKVMKDYEKYERLWKLWKTMKVMKVMKDYEHAMKF